jgi:hypothetical protein
VTSATHLSEISDIRIAADELPVTRGTQGLVYCGWVTK